ncbi:MAG: transketolase C-terminal domain-containing protein [Candidatus Paceibacterota bacterium]
MLKPEQKLNSKLFDLSVDQAPIRDGYGRGLVAAGEADSRVVALCADLTESTRTEAFAEKFPDRFIQVGVAEQNLAAVASGLSAGGKIPFITSYAMFSPGRNWEQIRTTICYNNQPVNIAGSHAGISVGPDGGTHQAIEDIAITRVIPRLQVIAPCDVNEAKKATLAAAKSGSPTYLRLARNPTPVVTTEGSPFIIGQANVLWADEKPAVAIIACGSLVYQALLAAKKLSAEGLPVSVTNLHTIKPLDEKTLTRVCGEASAVVTVEEHQKAGGLGSAVAEFLAGTVPKPMEFVAVNDEFGQSGEPNQLLEHYHLDSAGIIEAVKKAKGRT